MMLHQRRPSSLAGFTFVEVMVVMALMIAVSTVIYQAMTTSQRANAKGLEFVEEFSTQIHLSEQLRRLLRQSRSITHVSTGTDPCDASGTFTITYVSGTDATGTIIATKTATLSLFSDGGGGLWVTLDKGDSPPASLSYVFHHTTFCLEPPSGSSTVATLTFTFRDRRNSFAVACPFMAQGLQDIPMQTATAGGVSGSPLTSSSSASGGPSIQTGTVVSMNAGMDFGTTGANGASTASGAGGGQNGTLNTRTAVIGWTGGAPRFQDRPGLEAARNSLAAREPVEPIAPRLRGELPPRRERREFRRRRADQIPPSSALLGADAALVQGP